MYSVGGALEFFASWLIVRACPKFPTIYLTVVILVILYIYIYIRAVPKDKVVYLSSSHIVGIFYRPIPTVSHQLRNL